MATHPDYPKASSFKDRQGRVRWRYRDGDRATMLPGTPGDDAFHAAYLAVLAGQRPGRPNVVDYPGRIRPQSLGDSWEKWKLRPEWRIAAPLTREKNEALARRFLASKVGPHSDLIWRDVPVADLKRRHLREILAEHADTPHKAKHILVAIRKMLTVALDEEWIEFDPSHKIKWRPAYKGWRAWKDEELLAFVARWPAGTTPHLVFSLALWLGPRRSDIAVLEWKNRMARTVRIGGQSRIVRGFEFEAEKSGRKQFVPEAPPLSAALDATVRRGETIVITAYGQPFSEKSLTGRMADWTKAAGLPKGCTLHGLRKTLGKRMAEAGATTRQAMVILGHDDIEHAELYSREADSTLLAIEAMDKVTATFGDR